MTSAASTSSLGPRLRIGRTTRHALDGLAPDERRDLVDRCFAIYGESSRSLSRDEFDARFFSTPGTRVGLFHGTDGELAGFSNAAVLEVEVDGRRQRALAAGVYLRLRYGGGGRIAGRFGFTEALRHKLRHPLVPLAYLCMASNPAVYQLHHHFAERLWPLPDAPAPASLLAAVRAVSAARGLEALPDDPWRVRSFVRPRNEARLRGSRHLRDCPAAAFFDARNPGWADADHPTALLLWVPLDLSDIVLGLARIVLRLPKRRA